MARSRVNFVCQECGYDSPQWLGKCPECGNWNSFKEIKVDPISSSLNSTFRNTQVLKIEPKPLSAIKSQLKYRIQTTFSEMDGVLGGGIVPGSVTLLAGDPGIGKSTLLLQLALSIAANTKEKVLYISGEESEEQVKLRASRISAKSSANDNMLLLSQTNTDEIVRVVLQVKPALVILDSIQTMESQNVAGLSGAVGQIRYASQQFISVAKSNNIPFIMVGHVTKEGTVAGPMVLSHMVDCLLFLEGERFTSTRVLRSLKNRFGPVDEVGIFLMEETGMVEAKHPEQLFLNSQNGQMVPGSVMVVTLEGTRAFLVELQALVISSKLAYPKRVVSGLDSRRLELLLAVLQKHCRIPLDSLDVFVNVAGGLKISDPAVDLGVCLAVYSSFKNKALSKTVGISEVGLLGELRKVSMLDKRIKEAKKLGFSQIISVDKFKSIGDVLAYLDKK